MEYNGFGIPRRGYSMACGTRVFDGRLSVHQLPDRPSTRIGVCRSTFFISKQ